MIRGYLNLNPSQPPPVPPSREPYELFGFWTARDNPRRTCRHLLYDPPYGVRRRVVPWPPPRP